jgi:hypothetical protein
MLWNHVLSGSGCAVGGTSMTATTGTDCSHCSAVSVLQSERNHAVNTICLYLTLLIHMTVELCILADAIAHPTGYPLMTHLLASQSFSPTPQSLEVPYTHTAAQQRSRRRDSQTYLHHATCSVAPPNGRSLGGVTVLSSLTLPSS